MKKIFIVSLLFLSFMFSEQIQLGLVNVNLYNEMLKNFRDVEIKFKYDQSTDQILMYTYDFRTTVHILNKEDREIFISMFDKYIEWNEKAISKEVTLEKTIEIDLVVRGVFKSVDDWHWSCERPSNSIVAGFFSQNTKRHQLVLSFGKIQSCSNKYIDHKPDQLYVDYEEALIIKQLLTQDSLDKAIQEFEKQKSIEDDFK